MSVVPLQSLAFQKAIRVAEAVDQLLLLKRAFSLKIAPSLMKSEVLEPISLALHVLKVLELDC